MTDRHYVIEDRTVRSPPAYGAGRWLLWEVDAGPLPLRSCIGTFDTREAAEAARKIVARAKRE